MAGASKTLKITHLDLASSYFDSWAQLGAAGAKAWAHFPAPDRFGTGRLGCWHQVEGFCLVICFVHLHAVPLGFRLP